MTENNKRKKPKVNVILKLRPSRGIGRNNPAIAARLAAKKFLLTFSRRECYVFDMAKAEYTLKDVSDIFPQINPRTVQVWVKKGVIRPAVSSSGQGFPVKFSYLNLVEIGLVWQIVKLGLDSHAFFLKVMEYVEKYQKVNRWIDGRHKYECFFLYPEVSAFGRKLDEKEAQGYDEAPPFLLLSPERLAQFFQENGMAAGWLVVNVKVIKDIVDAAIASL